MNPGQQTKDEWDQRHKRVEDERVAGFASEKIEVEMDD